jgi:hypothetical protein
MRFLGKARAKSTIPGYGFVIPVADRRQLTAMERVVFGMDGASMMIHPIK